MIVVDASVLIAHLVEGDAHRSVAQDLLDTEEELAIHPMTLAESLVGPARIGREAEALRAIARIGIERLVPPDDEPVALARLRARTRLRLPDCCVLAAGLQGASTIATFDQRLATEARNHGLTVVGA